jgi:hypothetical protein
MLMLLALLGLAITIIVSFGPNNPGPFGFVLGVLLSVCLAWLGYRVQRNARYESSAEVFLPTLVAPLPAAHALRSDEVLGPWQFYVDAAASTVTVDLQSGGRYTQVIVPTCGERIECPGGTWTLDGPYVELTAYRSALRETMQRVRWFFGEGQNDLTLWAKDDPQGETELLGQRVLM